VAKPIVDGLESDLQGRARVMRFEHPRFGGMQAARRFGVRAVPAFYVVDGRAVWSLPGRNTESSQAGRAGDCVLAK